LLPKKAQDYFVALQDKIRASGIEFVSTLPNKLHVTMKFVGTVKPEDKQRLMEELKKPLSKIKTAPISVKPVGLQLLMRRDKSPKMILAILQSDDLQQLFQEIDDQLQNFIKKDTRPFLAHITIGTFPATTAPVTTAPDSQEIETKLRNIAIEDKDLELDEFKILALPANKSEEQYQDINNYEDAFTLEKMCKCKS
jgi:2'-5' RNA ligase